MRSHLAQTDSAVHGSPHCVYTAKPLPRSSQAAAPCRSLLLVMPLAKKSRLQRDSPTTLASIGALLNVQLPPITQVTCVQF